MNKKKGFTLIELLAIIVILAIIAVITVPIILNIINDAEKNSAMDSAHGYKDALQKYYATKSIQNPESELPSGYVDISELPSDFTVSGENPSNGWVKLKKGIVDKFSLKYDEYVVTMDNDKNVTSEKQENVDPHVPDEYKEVEYLESTGTQYIDTGVIPSDFNNKLSYNISVYQIAKQNSSAWVLGTSTGSGRFFNLNMGTNRWAIYAGTDSAVQLFSVPATTPAELNTWYDIDATIINGGTSRLSINGTEFTSQGIEVTSLEQIKLFSFGSASSSFTGRIKGLKLINPENNKTIRNLVPVVRKSDNKPGLYDLTATNLFDKDGVIFADNSYIKQDGTIVSDNNYYISDKIYLKQNSEYTWVFSDASTSIAQHSAPTTGFYNNNDELIEAATHNKNIKKYTFTVPENCAYIRQSVYKRENDYSYLYAGTEALPYEPYKKSFYTNDGEGEFIAGPEI